MEKIRRVIIYELFIDHFIELSTSICPFKSYNQALIYLKQAARLCGLLSDDGHPDKADQLFDKIEQLQSNILIERNRESTTRPQLPRRESFLEPSNRGKFRLKLPTQKNDPYTNIREKRSDSIQPERFVDNDEPTGTKYRKSTMATSPTAAHRLRRSSNRVNVQIHGAPKSGRLNENKENVNRGIAVSSPPIKSMPYFSDSDNRCDEHCPRTPETPIKTVAFFSDSDSMASGSTNGYSMDLRQHNVQAGGRCANRSISNDSVGDNVTTDL